ncbi:gluconokinase [Methylovirgula sp. 4M-Z18]|uniref:gluconokinase n=1 Tax=Methylovirgula sp. 4M-Z18 TaxID=2293567 RepID=UPI0018F75E0E|nr:gluconokinase [Methylovirgula sp. 4M-Z18]
MVLMGVAGSGKSSIGEALAARLGIIYLDGDGLHPAANIEKMSHGIPLTDDDRWPWLEQVGLRLRDAERPTAIGCSALKRSYRDFISKTAQAPVLFIYLAGSKQLIASRMHERRGHFMPESLLDSQFATLEEPAVDEHAIRVDIAATVEDIVTSIIAAMSERVGKDREQ